MTEQTNAELIAEANKILAENQWTSWVIESLAERLAAALEAAEADLEVAEERAEVAEKDRRYETEQKVKLAAVVEKVRAWADRNKGMGYGTGTGASALEILDILATAPADAPEAAEQERNQLAAVIEKAEDYVTRHYLDTRFGDEVLPILATAPADALRAVKAEAWDEGADAMAEHIDNGAWWETQNPYREEQS